MHVREGQNYDGCTNRHSGGDVGVGHVVPQAQNAVVVDLDRVRMWGVW